MLPDEKNRLKMTNIFCCECKWTYSGQPLANLQKNMEKLLNNCHFFIHFFEGKMLTCQSKTIQHINKSKYKKRLTHS